ncbi:MAG: hypothetical protein K5979_05535 [Ruminococcus sp.]|nr:hypothetical protein [Ruminococcus sp.]
MEKKTELTFKIFISILFIAALALGVSAFVVSPRNMVLLFAGMVCVLIGNVLNLVRIMITKRSK